MPRNNRNSDRNESDSDGNWMTTYSDMVTLLLAFFVLLFSFSNIEARKFDMLVESLRGKLGVLEGGRTVSQAQLIEAGMMGEGPGQYTMRGLYNVKAEIAEYLEEEELEEEIALEMTEEGLTIRFTGQVLFDLGRAEIRSNALDVLGRIGEFIGGVDNDVVVEGHTDDWPIRTDEFPSNWELSAARATNVTRYFIEEGDIDPERMSAAGYSEYQPIYPNDTSKNRARNRRVDVVLRREEEATQGRDLLEEREDL